MKRLSVLAALLIVASAAFAQHSAKGVVTNVDTAANKVTIKHEAVQSLHWPAMTMGFKVTDQKMLSTLKPGAKVDFEFVQQGRDYVITNVR